MEQNFLSLMPELQHKIILQDWSLTKNFYRTNKYFHLLLERDYIDNLCTKLIDEAENDHYERYQHAIMSMYEKITRENNIITEASFLLSIRHDYILRNSIREFELTITSTGINIGEVLHAYAFRNYGELPGIVDLLTKFNMFSHRQNCMRLYPNYAKDSIITDLTDIQTKYHEIKNSTDRSLIYKIILTNIYLQLFITKYTFNIAGESDPRKLLNLETNLEDVKHDIESMIEKIRRKILQL